MSIHKDNHPLTLGQNINHQYKNNLVELVSHLSHPAIKREYNHNNI